MLADVVWMGFSLTDSELVDWFTADDSPGLALLQFMNSHHFGMLLQLEEPIPVPGAIRTAGERDCGFSFFLVGDTSTSLECISLIHMFCNVGGSLGLVRHSPRIHSTSHGGQKLTPATITSNIRADFAAVVRVSSHTELIILVIVEPNKHISVSEVEIWSISARLLAVHRFSEIVFPEMPIAADESLQSFRSVSRLRCLLAVL